jgi:polyhydroxybutyrate depolymerase
VKAARRSRNARASRAAVLGAVSMLVPLPGAACAVGASREAAETTRRVVVDGRLRSYLLRLPSRLKPNRPAPVIIAFHGGIGTAGHFARRTKLAEQASSAGFVVALPQGFRRSWNAGDCCGPAETAGIDDVAFARAVLADVATVVLIDQRRIFATGFSNGGKLVYRLACQLSDRVAAVAVVAAAISLTPGQCRPVRPVSVLHVHGTADPFAPYQGGRSANRRAGEQRSVPVTIEYWLIRDRCRSNAVPFKQGALVCRSHRCAGGTVVVLCPIEGMGHQWPGSKPIFPRRLGKGSEIVSVTAVIIRFFQQHGRVPRA